MRLADSAPMCACRKARRPAARTMGASALLYHSFGDVAAEKIRINAIVSQTVAAWNACSGSATDATGQQLSVDFNAWYTTWTDFTNTGQTEVADFPDNAEWDTMQVYESQLSALTARINAYCGSGLPGPAPSGSTPDTMKQLTTVILAVAAVVVLVELAPLIDVVADGLDDLVT